MNAPIIAPTARPAADAFAAVPQTAAEHCRLALFGVVAHIIEACADGDRDAALAAHPFLADYADEMAERCGAAVDAAAWHAALRRWEAAADPRLPLRALRRAGLGDLEIALLLAAGLLEEDPRFAELFEQAGGRRRPTLGLLLAWWRGSEPGADRAEAVRRALLGLVRAGLLQVHDAEAPRSEWMLAVPAPLWDALRGEPPALPWLRHLDRAALVALPGYVAPPALARACAQLPALLAAEPDQIVVVRGPRHNGRKTLLGALAQALGKGVLIAEQAVLDDPPRWQLAGVLAVLLDALPVIDLTLAPGENRALPPLPLASGPIAIATGLCGGIHPRDGRALLTVTLPLPDAACRRRHWQAAAPPHRGATLDDLAGAMCLSSGTIRRAARAAAAYARLDGRDAIEVGDVQLACRGLHDARLETLATRLDARGGLGDLAVDAATRAELDILVARCRHREALAAVAAASGIAAASGVRALLAGPSGTGKTLAARLLAATLGKDIYRIDLSATVNKYLGETEKNLEHAFAAAEELDVVLLLDEGDALMTARTDVASANDRYANLETNFLLQRIESFAGILLVTSNAADRIDKAFARRMDVVIAFPMPDELRRYEILGLHLGRHAVADDWLQEVAYRCALTGGQLRNVVTHAQLLALQADRVLDAADLYAALLREYRKAGAHCPVRRPAAAGEV